MNLLFLLFAVVALPSPKPTTSVAAATPFGAAAPDSSLQTFMKFKTFFAKEYANYEEFSARFAIFKHNVEDILEHNFNASNTYHLGINQFTDLTVDEFSARVKGLGGASATPRNPCKTFASTATAPLPEQIDWRELGAVTPVKNQGQCGSCWTFSATGALEGALFKATSSLISLSEQQLVDCSHEGGNNGCNGGLMDDAFEYVMDNGLCSEAAYPYKGVDGSCIAERCESSVVVAPTLECYDIPANNQVALKAAVAITPVSIAIEADKRIFQSYSSGVITGSKCGTNLDHGVLIVGYGEEDGHKYWLVKNSWDTTWGDEGYIKLGRSEETDDAGVCGVAMSASFPLFVEDD